MKPYRNHPDVPAEVDAAASWYEEQEPGLGLEFVLAVESAIALICDAPHAWQLWPGTPSELGIRRFVMRRFPFAVSYLDEPAEVVIVAVSHAKRKPLYWLHRIRGR